MTVYVQQEDFDVEAILQDVSHKDVGAIVTFIGLCRDVSDAQTIEALHVEHYPGMTERQLERIQEEAYRRWPLLDCILVHRYGWFYPLDRIVLVATATAHRQDAFESCNFLMDWVKTQAPFWKKEHTPYGMRWVEAQSSDNNALKRWWDKP